LLSGLTITSNVYINKSLWIKIKLKIESWGKQNHDFDLEAILGDVAISTSISEIEPALETITQNKCDNILAVYHKGGRYKRFQQR